MILCIETATGVCSAALCDEQGVMSVLDAPPGMSHAAQLTVIIRRLLADASITAGGLDAVAVSKGPGSYTGLRIGVSVAKGIAYGAGIPLIGINTLLAMCYGYLSINPLSASPDVLLCPMIDARRMEVYNALLRPDGTFVRDTSADIIDESSFREVLEKKQIVFFGGGAEKCKNIIRHPNAVFY
jgi:tRNA threonylcarbamoyladenosine biosynthesis protein TsaB